MAEAPGSTRVVFRQPVMTPASNANLYALLAQGFPTDTDACAIEAIEPDGSSLYYTWGDIDRASAKIANLLVALKLPAGARVAVQVEKSPEALLLYLATLRAGYVYLPLNTAYQASELDYFLGNASPGLVVCSPSAESWVRPLAKRHRVGHVLTLDDRRQGTLLAAAAGQSDRFRTVRRAPGDLAAILYTSGTTGRSKGAMLSHANLSSNAQTLHHY